MTQSNFIAHWKNAADDLGIEFVGPFDLKLPSGAHIHVPVLVRYFGGPEGMLIVTDFGLVKDLSDEIIQAGYGCSVMSVRHPLFWSPGSSGTIPRLFMPEPTYATAPVASGMNPAGNVPIGSGLQIGG